MGNAFFIEWDLFLMDLIQLVEQIHIYVLADQFMHDDI